jgi:tetratricopeptide (TPR) repeat protein
LTAVIVDCGERAYVEDATRPTLSRTAVATPSIAASTTSRISVDFNTPTNSTEMPVKPAPQRSTAPRSSLFSGLVQLILLVAALASAFAAGRYWNEIVSFVTGAPVASSQAPSSPTTSQPETNPDLAAAQALFEERRYDKALKSFADLVSKDGTNAEARYWLGRTHLEMKQPSDAVKQLSEAAKLDSKLPNIFVHLALAYEAAGDKKNATEALRRAIAPVESPVPTVTATPAG